MIASWNAQVQGQEFVVGSGPGSHGNLHAVYGLWMVLIHEAGWARWVFLHTMLPWLEVWALVRLSLF